jgi:hypothetical protein
MAKSITGINKSNFENRAIVLEFAVMIEDMLSLLLSVILKISNKRDSISLGTQSSGLSFNAKANLLLDMKYLKKEDRWKFQKFMAIRNQFAHNLKVQTFEQCFQIVTDKNKLLMTYPSTVNSSSIEEQLREAFIALGLEIISLGKSVISKFGEEYRREKILETLSLFTSAVFTSLKNTGELLTEKSDLTEFLLILQKSLPEETKKILAASLDEKNKWINSLIQNSNIHDLIREDSLTDYFSDQEIADYNLKQDGIKIKIPL